MHKDFLGNNLNIGDFVIAISPNKNSGANFVHGVITRFTPKMVSIIDENSFYSNHYDKFYETLIYPNKLILDDHEKQKFTITELKLEMKHMYE